MKHNIYYSPEALHDLDEIRDYFLSELFCPDAATLTVNKIITAIDILERFPEIDSTISNISSSPAGKPETPRSTA